MLIYAYADILGYRAMLKKHSSTEIYSLLNDAFSEMHRMLDQYTNSEPVMNEYRSGLLDQSDYWELFLNQRTEKLRTLRSEISQAKFSLKTYIAFDTIVVYWDSFEISETNMMLFLLAIDLLYLILYEKDILIRGAIGTTDDFFIDEKGAERFFIINNISAAAAIEKNQNSANLIVFGEKLATCFYSIQNQGLTDDYYERLDYYSGSSPIIARSPDYPRVHFKEGFIEKVIIGEAEVSANDLFDRKVSDSSSNITCITICPVNNLTFSYLGIDFYEKLYRKVKYIHDGGKGQSHVEELIYNTACLLFSRLESDIYNATTIMTMWDNDLNTELPLDHRSVLDLWKELKRRVGYGK